jgi:aspartyl/asparaginyl beta-hydroxylase (cupin superfamily)
VLFAQGQIKAADSYNDWGFNSFFRAGWKRFYLKWYEAPLPWRWPIVRRRWHSSIRSRLRTRAMTAVNRWVSRNIINESTTQNEAGERVGWLNRAFGYIYHLRLVGKRMKAWNKRVYYAVKYFLIGGIVAGFLATAFA